MATTPIDMVKIKIKDSIHYYFVTTDKQGLFEFYIGIDPNNLKVLYFIAEPLDKPIAIQDFNIDEPLVHVPGLPFGITLYVSMRALKLMRNNTFPEKESIVS